MKAVILAAGMGNRLRPITNKIPKAFLEIDKKKLIIHSLENLNNAGFSEVIIVVGYLSDLFREEIGDKYQDLKIKYVLNPDYSNTGSMYSLSQTEGFIDDDILLLESDLLYEKRALQTLFDSNDPNVILVTSFSGSGDEVFICVNENNELTGLGKKITEKNKAIGELVGIMKLSLDFLNQLYEKAKEHYVNNEMQYHYEEVIYKLSKTYPIKCRLIEDLRWIEIDTEEDFKRAKNKIYPKINEKDDS